MIKIKIVLILGRGGLLLLLVLVQVVLLGELQVPQELRITTWMRRDFSVSQVKRGGNSLERGA